MKAPRILRRQQWRFFVTVLLLLATATAVIILTDGEMRRGRMVLFVLIPAGPALSIGNFVIRRRLERRTRIHDCRVCSECGYLLHGLPDAGRCPECGVEYEWTKLKQQWQKWVGLGDLSPREVRKQG